MTVLVTERLHLAPIQEADEPALLALFNEPEVGRYLLDGERVTKEWVQEELGSSERRFGASAAGLWALRRRAQDQERQAGENRGAILGVVGYRPFFDPPQLQLLYALHPSAWGEGLATEAARAAVVHGFEALGLDEVLAATDAPNEASVRVLERLGMSRWKTTPGEPWDTIFFRIRREEWDRGSGV